MKKIFLIIFFLLLIFLFFLPYLCLSIHINGEENLTIHYGENYEEKGASITFLGKQLTPVIKGTINTSILGHQEVTYSVSNYLGIIKQAKRKVNVVDTIPPTLTLLGPKKLTLIIGDSYQEAGYQLIDNVDGDISLKTQISGYVDTSKVGTYELLYKGEDTSHNTVTEKRIIEVIEPITYRSNWDTISNYGRSWWSGNKKNNTRPITGAGATEEFLKQYNAYYMGSDEKTIYLTFDVGSNDTYTKEIADILYQNDVKATFFVCGNFVKTNPELMKQFVEQGHSVGNHTYHHHAMYDYANASNFATFLKEIEDVEKEFYNITGQEMDKVYREPRGEYSERTLAIMQSMGYKTYFWSADYYDFAYDVSAETAFENYYKRYHNGAIFLIHPTNKGNYLAMDRFVKEMKKLGYSFGLVRDIS